MFTTNFGVVLDANVLFPLTLRDSLLRAASDGYYRLYWSDKILHEVSCNLLKKGMITDEQAAKLVNTMKKAFPDAMVLGYQVLVDSMPNQEKDRHVTAAAVKAGAQLIVTSNLRDFQLLPVGVEAQSPDDFLLSLFDLDSAGIIALLKKQSAALQNPPKTFDELLIGLGKSVPQFVNAVHACLK